jgi:two-component system, OmpR family, response regulator
MAPRILVVDDNQELLTLLTQLFEEAGYSVAAAVRGKQGLELARATPPEIAILDILLPDMMGYHVADMLRKERPNLPLVFVTGVFKGGRHAVEARQKYDAAAYFEKPFEAHKLLQAVAAIVPPGKKPEAPSAEDAFDDLELDIDVEEPQEAMELTGKIRVTGGGDVTAELRGATLTASPISPQHTRASEPVRANHGPTPERPSTQAAGTRRGELKDNLPSLINAFWLAKETGELGVQRGKVKKVVYFEKGQPVFALSNLASDRFGQFLVRVGKIRAEQLQDAAVVAANAKRRTGDVLIERGLLKETERLYYVAQQVKSIIYSLFGWEDGSYVMSFKDRATREPVKLDAHPGQLIVRGVKKLYKPERLRRLVRADERLLPSLQPAYQLHEVELERWESELLPRVDGMRTVGDLHALAHRPEHVVNAFLVAMLALNVLERRVAA